MYKQIDNISIRTTNLGEHGHVLAIDVSLYGDGLAKECHWKADRSGVAIYASRERLIRYCSEALRQLEANERDDETVDIAGPVIVESAEPATEEFSDIQIVRIAS